MTEASLLQLLLLLLVALLAGAIAEAVVGAKIGPGSLGTLVVGLVGAWLGHMFVPIGPVLAGVYVVSAIIGAIIFALLIILITRRRVVI
jgi:uncharacterized membrane protein YeaQ/YmgE (transglycosylase-associated protein family)